MAIHRTSDEKKSRMVSRDRDQARRSFLIIEAPRRIDVAMGGLDHPTSGRCAARPSGRRLPGARRSQAPERFSPPGPGISTPSGPSSRDAGSFRPAGGPPGGDRGRLPRLRRGGERSEEREQVVAVNPGELHVPGGRRGGLASMEPDGFVEGTRPAVVQVRGRIRDAPQGGRPPLGRPCLTGRPRLARRNGQVPHAARRGQAPVAAGVADTISQIVQQHVAVEAIHISQLRSHGTSHNRSTRRRGIPESRRPQTREGAPAAAARGTYWTSRLHCSASRSSFGRMRRPSRWVRGSPGDGRAPPGPARSSRRPGRSRAGSPSDPSTRTARSGRPAVGSPAP